MPLLRLACPSLVSGVVLLVCLQAAVAADAPAPAAAEAVQSPSPERLHFFETKVRPLLADNCFKCHGEEKQEENLRVDSRAALLSGGDRGAAIVPGAPDDSLLIKAVNHLDDLEMPPKKKLSADQIADLTTWVKTGAVWPDDGKPAPTRKPGLAITDKDRAFWSFQPVKQPAPPTVKDAAWVANPIDAFVLAKLEANGLRPNPPASKRELIRRLSYDLTGLPPSPAEVEAFAADRSPGAYAALVDRLLESPHYGEKWGRHWLDLFRYAETNSYERDGDKPHAWRFRDFVIRSLNDDKPYDRFIRELLAGDELPDGAPDSIVGTGFYRLGIWDDEPSDRDQARFDGLDDILTTTGQVFLGLTVDCARCHDHKIDPIPQKDYYRLLSFFRNVNHFNNGGPTDEAPLSATAVSGDEAESVREIEQQKTRRKKTIAALERQFAGKYFPAGQDEATAEKNKGMPLSADDIQRLIVVDGERILGKPDFARYQKAKQELKDLDDHPAAGMALVATEAGSQAPDTYVLLRGNPHNQGDKVEPAFPQVLGGQSAVIPTPAPGAKTTGRRLALANWIASPANPLTARVAVNRIWQYHFGRGIVRSPNNFGYQGDKPTHPELLDWLAAELVSSGWRLKSLHRLIVTSSAYQMSSAGNAESLAKDPTNDLFWRFDMRRLTAEEIRDSILAVSGTLNLKMYGPPIYPEIPAAVLAGQSHPGAGWGKSTPEEQARRSLYVHVKRSLLVPLLESFDVAESDRTNPVRFSTTQPTQALGLLNGEFANRQAALLADRLRKEAGADSTAQVRLALNLVTDRPPTDAEVRKGLDLIERLKRQPGVSDEQALKYFCLAALNLNEFVYLD